MKHNYNHAMQNKNFYFTSFNNEEFFFKLIIELPFLIIFLLLGLLFP